MTEKAPAISKELVEYLERVYKDRCPDRGTPVDDVWFAAGAAHVVRHLRKLFNDQNNPSNVIQR